VAGLESVDVNLLVALGALLEERNLTRAGDRIGMTQPAMSGALGRLRIQLGDQLLVRVGRGYELSVLALTLLPDVLEALNQVERTLGAARSFDPAASTRHFTVSLSDYALSVLARPLQALIHAEAPRVSIEFDSVPAGEAVETHLLRRDLIIAGSRLPFACPRRPLFRDRFVCVVSDTNSQVGDELTLDQLAELPYLDGSFGDSVVTLPMAALQAAGVTPRVVTRAPGLLTLPLLVAGTDLVAFVPRRLVRRCSESLGLRIVSTPLEIPPLIEAANWHPTNTREAGLVWLLDLLARACEQLREPSAAVSAGPADASHSN
jgi:DNA-binding transcriptional LysR family regulator